MENSKPNVIVPYHDPTADDQPSAEQLLDFGNEDAPSLGYDRNLGFDQNAQVPRPSNINPLPNSGQDVVVGSYTLVPISAPVFGPFDTRFASSSRSGPPSTNFMPVPPGQHLADPTNLGASPSNVVPGLNSNVNSGTVVNGVNDPIWDPNFWNFLNDSTIVHQGGHFSGNDGGNCYDNPQGGADFGNPITLPIWPILPSPYSCSGCQTLREIIHTNGVTITNLEIHGRLGTNITHAILDTYDFNYSSENHTYQMFDFSNESIDSIKSFLLQYCEYRRLEGFSLVEDPLTVFFKALLIDIDDVENQIPYLPQPTAMDTG
ncbi:OLC1v1031939C2 [Oldenlandia corymbosa var. corymbosa]|uniref:OLC1v1031939C2 n=1 Tax=Oldenlandia corymbosa var. corymbosa TaxID=529605 RepID=A0AAV1CMI2_OLDCO|nr:OLC1v1031939C2 [Oldenlandia corymbosa var. corymbosa]